MSVFVKICGLRDANTVAAAIDAGADAIGFVFADSLRRVEPGMARSMAEDIPQSVRSVAVMRHPSNDEWQSVLAEFSPDVLQTDAEDFDFLIVPDSIERWPVLREGVAPTASANVFVYEGQNSGAGESVDWTVAAEMAARGRMILAGGLAADNVATAIKTAGPWGVDVSSGVESSPGQKNIELIKQFIAAVRATENEE